jgi:uncharacterized protein
LQIVEPGADGRPLVEAYGPGGFRIDGRRTEGSVLILPDRALDWSVSAPEDITIETLAFVIEAASAVEILLLGCGAVAHLPSRALRDAMRSHGISLEPMDTGAACRTYNVLVGEARSVAAALIAL